VAVSMVMESVLTGSSIGGSGRLDPAQPVINTARVTAAALKRRDVL